MKSFLTSLCLYFVLPVQLLAGYYGDFGVDEYDPATGLYYKAVTIERENRGFINKGPSTQVTNISIFIPETEEHSLLFKDEKQRSISFLLYEMGVENGAMKYRSTDQYRLIKNNNLKTSRLPKDKLLIGVRLEKDQEVHTELWSSDKHGSNLKLLTILPSSQDWHIDVRNSKIRIISSDKGKFSHKSIEW